jgi:integrase/recombinase XerD
MNPTYPLPPDRRLTLEGGSSLFLDVLRLAGRSEATLRIHKYALRTFGKSWGERDLREATEADLEAYARSTLGRVGRETAYLYLSSVRSLFRHLVEAGLLLVDPAARLPMPRMAERLTGAILAPEAMKRLVESPDLGGPCGVRDRALLECLYSTGLRTKETLGAAVGDVGEDTLTVRSGKGGKDRTLPVGPGAMAWIRRYLADVRPAFSLFRPGEEALWLTRWGRPFSRTLFQKHLSALGRSAGVVGLTCHLFRRSLATHLLAAGASPIEVSRILGHEDLRSLGRYVKVVERDLRATHAETHPREQP